MKSKTLILTTFILFLVVFPAQPGTAQENDKIEIILHKEILPSESPLWGLSNIFFRNVEKLKVSYPEEWQNVEIAGVLENRDYKPVYCIKHKDTTGDFKYVLDTDADLDFSDEKALHFEKKEKLAFAGAEVKISVIKENGSNTYSMNYQIVTSEEDYIYARINEFRRGNLQIDQKVYPVILRPGGRGHPCFDLTAATQCFIDYNADGDFSQQWSIDENQQILKSEQIPLSMPFMIENNKYQASKIDIFGNRLEFQSSNLEESTSLGFKAPAFEVTTFEGKTYSLDELQGKTILLEFWSPDCPYSERVRPWIDSMVKKNSTHNLIILSVMIRPNEEDVKTFLKDHSIKSIIVQANNRIQDIYNPRIITPVF